MSGSRVPTLPRIRVETVTTRRLRTRVLFGGAERAVPVLFLHGNLSSATWWEETLLSLPSGFGGADSRAKVDATRGMEDFVLDAVALLDELGIEAVHLVGNSLGGVIVYQALAEISDRLITATLVGPGSPFGFGGTKDAAGTRCAPDYAGSGGGLFAAKLIARIQAGDRGMDHRFSPRNALRDLVYRQPFIPTREEDMLSALLEIHTGAFDLPGDVARSENWPYFAPGDWGPTNALSPKHLMPVGRMFEPKRKPPILWVRGSDDVAISDRAASDPVTFGQLGLIPGWPGPDVYPHQPMLAQTRATLDRYVAEGGSYREVVIEDSGHVAFIEKPREFCAAFHAHIGRRT
jgi:pimeloyl-ACP methyl ester carboxylesterase